MPSSPRTTLPTWLAEPVDALRAGDLASYLAIYAPHAVYEFPFAPDGAVRRLEGRETISACMDQLPGIIRFGSFSELHVRDARAELIVEANGHHTRVSDSKPVDLSYIWFITRQDGLVTHFRDHMNPLQLVRAIELARMIC